MKNILVPVDFSDVTDRVIDMAETMARAFGSKVWVLHTVTDTSFLSGNADVPITWDVVEADLPKHFPSEFGRLRELVARLQDKGIDADLRLASGPAIEQVLDTIDKREIGLVIMGSHGHGALYELLVGTVSEGVMRRTSKPVMIVPSFSKKVSAKEGELERRWEATMATPY